MRSSGVGLLLPLEVEVRKRKNKTILENITVHWPRWIFLKEVGLSVSSL